MMKLTGICGAVASLAVSDSFLCEADAARFGAKAKAPTTKKQLYRLAAATAGGLLSQGTLARADAECGDMCKDISDAYAAMATMTETAVEAGGGLILFPGSGGMLPVIIQSPSAAAYFSGDFDGPDEPTAEDQAAFELTGGFLGWDLSSDAINCVSADDDSGAPVPNSQCTEAICKKACAESKNGVGEPCTSYFYGQIVDDGKAISDMNVCGLSTGKCTEGVSGEDFGSAMSEFMEFATAMPNDGERRLEQGAGEMSSKGKIQQHMRKRLSKLAGGKDVTEMLKDAKLPLGKVHSGSSTHLRRLDNDELDMSTDGAAYAKDGTAKDPLVCSGAFSARNLAPAVALAASVVGVASAVAGM